MATVRFALMAGLLGVFAFVSPCAAENAGPQAAEIRAALSDWKDQFNARNSSVVCGLFAPDLIAMFQGQPVRKFSEVCALLRRSLNDATRHYHYGLEIKDVFASGDLGAVRLVWTLTVTGKDGAVLETSVEPGIDIFQRQPDGKWKIARYLCFAQSAPH